MPIDSDSISGLRAGGDSSISKAVRVLRSLVVTTGNAESVSHLAELANLPKSTTHRILAVLVDEGWVTRCDQLYRLGPAWFELQSALSSSEWQTMLIRAKKPLATLLDTTAATVHFAVLDGDEILYLEDLRAPGGTTVPIRVGDRKPALCTALGKAIAAYADSATLQSLLCTPLPTSHLPIASQRIVLTQLEKVRQSGVAYEREDVHPSVHCVAAPVLRAGKAVAAVSVSRVGDRPTTGVDAVAVRRAAADIAYSVEEEF